MPYTEFEIRPARSDDDVAATVRLLKAYAASIGVDLTYQDFAGELAAMPGKYAPPGGELLLARASDGTPLGCVALRAIDPVGCCEMKRLYVTSAARGLGLGRALVDAIVATATAAGYRELRLDTLPDMIDAQALYARMGFERIEAYYDTPIAGTVFMAMRL